MKSRKQTFTDLKEGHLPRLRINDIEDMLPPVVVQNTATNLSGEMTFRLRNTHKECSQQKLGYIRSESKIFTRVEKLPARRTTLIQSDELYKFSDRTLTGLQTSLADITKNIRMEYLPKRRWSTLEKKKS
ncbi:hypothetical protein Tco_1484670 [Tanacetum coccineum]